MDTFAVIGLGRFGSRLAGQLAWAGAEVIAIDRDRNIVEELRDRVTLAIALDSTDEAALKLQGIDQVDCAIVGIGQNFEANALTTALLKGSLHVKRVIARARTSMQEEILMRIGADAVVKPEEESADRWNKLLLAPYALRYVELGAGYAVVQVKTPKAWIGPTLSELDLRTKHNVTVVAIKRKSSDAVDIGPADTRKADARKHEAKEVVDLPVPGSRLNTGDTIVLAGFDKDIKTIPRNVD
ncbi:MAG: TrkA family potassium uptake protein [Phycisphaeraceae bacterium]|nr:MAG: TrkA family potassium uptake protein [Phycisphaeraceae bacterium]